MILPLLLLSSFSFFIVYGVTDLRRRVQKLEDQRRALHHAIDKLDKSNERQR